MWSVFFAKLVINRVLSKNGFIIGFDVVEDVEQSFYKLVLLCFFFDSRAKARLIYLDTFLKPNFPRFFRKVKISWLSKNGLVIGTRRSVKTMGTFLKNLLTLSSFFCFKLPVFFFLCIFFFVEHLVFLFLWWRLVVYLCQCCGHYFFAENSVSSLPLFFRF